ncbi:hypothetical protein [Anaerobiospirillum sp. NML120511]|nr:hypothetical protein [Anaerobiospirillum sp. NML120511]MCK0535181.1 hypothetical protein [Anaerobiospirillum sp. NML120511]
MFHARSGQFNFIWESMPRPALLFPLRSFFLVTPGVSLPDCCFLLAQLFLVKPGVSLPYWRFLLALNFLLALLCFALPSTPLHTAACHDWP